MLICAVFADGVFVHGFMGGLMFKGFVLYVAVLFMTRGYFAGDFGYQPYGYHFTALFKLWLYRGYVHEALKFHEDIGGTEGL